MSEELKPNPWMGLEDKAEDNLPIGALQIYEWIRENLSRTESTEINRGSAATMCPKRNWFQKNSFKGIPLTPRKIMNFIAGDIAEAVVLFFIKGGCVGPGKLYSEVDFGIEKGSFTVQNGFEIKQYHQEDLFTDCGGITIKSHADGWGKRNFDNQWELIEVKSAADYGYDKFKKDGAGDYLRQSHVSMASSKAVKLGVKSVRHYFFKKNTGNLWDRIAWWDDSVFRQVIEGYKTANQKDEPTTPYPLVQEMKYKKPTGRMIAGFPSSYCPYIEFCHKGIKKGFKDDWGGGKTPVFYR